MDDIIGREVLRAIDGSDHYRLLRRLDLRTGDTGVGMIDDTGVAVVLDTETTGIGEEDAIIELALRRIRFDSRGTIVEIGRRHSWLEDPGRALPPDVARLTGICDADLAGRSIDERAVMALLRSAEFVCAHNARFDAGVLARRLPEAAGLAWACSCHDVDWRAAGFDGGRSLGWLLGQIGFFHGAHRAGDDVDAVIALLAHRLPSGRTALAEMVETARSPSWRIHAVGAAFDVKDLLKARGYRWDGGARTWWREVRDSDREAEECWLETRIYSPEVRLAAEGPMVDRVTWRERYA